MRSTRSFFVTLTTIVFSSCIPLVAAAATNLIQNPSFTDPSATNINIPAHWNVGGYSTLFTGRYPVPGVSDDFAAEMIITSTSGGDAKWFFDNVPVEPGAQYSITDSSSSTVPSLLTAAYTHADGTQTFEVLGAIIPALSDWQTTTRQFTVPTSPSPVVSLTVFHAISDVGTIDLDDYSLTPTFDAAHNLLPAGVVSLSFDDGWISQYDEAFARMQTAGLRGSFYIISNAMKGSSHDVFTDHDALADMATTTTATSIRWSPIYVDTASPHYFLSSTYTSAATVSVSVNYTIAGTPGSITKTFPAGTNTHLGFSINLPANTDPGIAINVSSAATLSMQYPSMMEISSGYMTPTQISAIAAAGHEIGAHSMDHCSMARLQVDASDIASCAFPPLIPVSMQTQVTESRSALLDLVGSVDTFAYPYGEFNASVESFVAGNGYIGARATTPGFNTINSDKYALMVQTVDNTTSAARIKEWIDTAIANRLWLILLFHQVDDPAALASNGEDGGTTPEIFQDVLNYLASKPAGTVKTVRDELHALSNTPAPDEAAPVIASHDTISTTTSSTSGAMIVYTNPTATDDRDGAVATVCSPASGSLFPIGTTTVTCTAHDSSNNTASSDFAVIIKLLASDLTPPVIAPKNDMKITTSNASGTEVAYTNPTATDTKDGSVPVICAPESGSFFVLGTTTVACTAHDSALNYATSTFLIIVSRTPDRRAPVITLLGNSTVKLGRGTPYHDQGATALDDRDGNITEKIISTSNVNISVIGIYAVRYNVSDAAGNNAREVRRIVRIVAATSTPFTTRQ